MTVCGLAATARFAVHRNGGVALWCKSATLQPCRWMVKDRRAIESPVAHLDGLNVKTARRHDRRALTVDELRALLNAAESGPERYGMTGAERALLYRLAVETGLRAGELRSLTRASFDLDGDPPTATVAAASSKRRRDDTLTLRPPLAVDLRAHTATLAPATAVFSLPRANEIIRMFKRPIWKAPGSLIGTIRAAWRTFIRFGIVSSAIWRMAAYIPRLPNLWCGIQRSRSLWIATRIPTKIRKSTRCARCPTCQILRGKGCEQRARMTQRRAIRTRRITWRKMSGAGRRTEAQVDAKFQ